MDEKRARWRQLRGALALAFLGLLLVASHAQAHEWIVEGQELKKVPVAGEEGATFSSSQQSGLFTFDWPLGFHDFKWACTEENGTGTLWPATGKLDAFSTATFKWSNCHFTEEVKCPIHTPVVARVKGELIKNEKTGILYEKYVPSTKGGAFFEFSWGLEECSIGGTWNFGGSFAAKLEPAGTELLTHPQTFSPEIEAAAGTAIKASESSPPLSISGALKLTLTGELKGQKWGAT